MADKFGEPARLHWMNERTVADYGLRGYHPVERDDDDQEQKFNADSRVRSGDRFLAAIPESVAQQRDQEKRAKRINRLLALQQGGQLGAEVASMIRRGIFSPRFTENGYEGKGYMVKTDAAKQMGVNPAMAQAPWLGAGHDSQPTPNEMASHIERMQSQAGLPEPGDFAPSTPQMRALEAAQRWSKGTVGSVADNPHSLGKTLRRNGD
jgi:hypothetical protein